MSFASQPETSRLRRSFSKSSSSAQRTPGSGFAPWYTASVAVSDWPKRASRSPSAVSEDLPFLPSPSPLFDNDYQEEELSKYRKAVLEYSLNVYDTASMVRSHSLYNRHCDMDPKTCPSCYLDQMCRDGISSYPLAALHPRFWVENRPIYTRDSIFFCSETEWMEGDSTDHGPASLRRPFSSEVFLHSYAFDPENPKKQQAFMRRSQTYGGIHSRYKVQRERCRLSRDRPVDRMVLEAANEFDENDFCLFTTKFGAKCDSVLGHVSLETWRRGAGDNKSWKRCPRNTVPKQTYPKWVSKSPGGFEHQFAKCPLWLPASFLRSEARKQSIRLRFVLQRQVSDQGPDQARYHDPHVDNDEDYFIELHKRHRATAIAHDSNGRRSEPVAIEEISTEPGGAFLRFTWKEKILTNGRGQLDRFLPTGLVFRTGWSIVGFLRNESHTDVYSLINASFGHSTASTKVSWEAHVFLDEYHGNCANYAKRLKGRMRDSGDCLDTLWYGDRHVFVMEIQKKHILFRLRNTEEEFPILVDQNKCNEQVALRRRSFRGKPSFAAVVGGRRPVIESFHQKMPTLNNKSALEKELDQIEKARLKKAERQRVKRQSQREKRLG